MQQHTAERGLAAAGLADDADRLTAPDREIDLAHRFDFTAAREEAAAAKTARHAFGRDKRNRIAIDPLVPAEAGTQGRMRGLGCLALDSRFRGNERSMVRGHATSFHLWQRDARVGLTSANGGFTLWHSATTQAQRGAKLQPAGRRCGSGTVPGIAESCASTPSGALALRARVYGWRGRAK